MKHLANGITISRIVASFMLIATNTFSTLFFLLYAYCGISDMIDGIVARKTATVSKVGSTLDSVADFIFVLVCMIKVLSFFTIRPWCLIWIGIIVLVKIINLISGYIYHKRVIFLHTTTNKIVGFLLFLSLFVITNMDADYIFTLLCAFATFAAIQEGHFIRTGRIEDKE